MESVIKDKTNYAELLMQLYLDIKELKDDWTEIVEEGIDIDNIMRTYKFYVKYIEKIDNGDLSFDDYVLFYIQDRSEYAAKCLLEKIWEEMNILLEIYDSNRKIFNKYDCKGLSNSIIQVPCYFNYNDILISLEKKDPEELDKIWGNQLADVDQNMKVESLLREYIDNLSLVREKISSEIESLNTKLNFISQVRNLPFFFDLFTENIIEYTSILGKYIGKVLIRKQIGESVGNCAGNQILPCKIEGKLLDALYALSNEVVFRLCDKKHFEFIINGGQPKENQDGKVNDIKHLNRFYYLIRMMKLGIPQKQYELWKDGILKAQNIKEETFDKKWNSISKDSPTPENMKFKEQMDSLVKQYMSGSQETYNEMNSTEL